MQAQQARSNQTPEPLRRRRITKIASRVIAIMGALATICRIVIALVTVIEAARLSQRIPSTPDSMKEVLAGANLLILIAFCWWWQETPSLSFVDDSEKVEKYYCQILNVQSMQARSNAERVNKLVNQLRRHINWYAIFLIAVYSLYLFDNNSVIRKLLPDQDYSSVHHYLSILIIPLNYGSAVFLFLAFKVLYDKTIKPDNSGDLPYYRNEILISCILGVAYLLYCIHSTEIGLSRVRLFVGGFNGLAMCLLFGRYLSMEHFSYNMRETVAVKDKFNHFFTIYLLPLYALSQPLFGSFEIGAFGDTVTFANWVFFVCLIGKAFFLYFTFQVIKDRSIHYYLHSVLSRHGAPRELAAAFQT